MANCDPASLLEAVRCFGCIPAGMLASVGTNLLCQFANLPTGEVCQHDLVDAWVARVIANGGAPPTAETREALCTFCHGLDTDLLTDKMIAVNPFVPDNIIAARTPLITPVGINLWDDNPASKFTDGPGGDLTVAGLKGNGVNKWLNTHINPTVVVPGDRDWGATLYNTFADNSNTKDMGAVDNGGFVNNDFQFLFSFGGQAYLDCWDGNADRTNGLNNAFTGFITGNRTAINLVEIYRANTAAPNLALVASNNAAMVSTRPNSEIYVFAIQLLGAAAGWCSRRFSFAAIHNGLVKADAQNLFNRVQQLRIDLGGGTA